MDLPAHAIIVIVVIVLVEVVVPVREPEAALRALCEAIGIPFSEDMLHWPAGKRASDGAWAAVWYDAVERSTGFGDPSPEPGPLPENLEAIAAEGRAPYEALKARALRP